eukprot:3343958-Pleurochrysis_carterae.AAC.4
MTRLLLISRYDGSVPSVEQTFSVSPRAATRLMQGAAASRSVVCEVRLSEWCALSEEAGRCNGGGVGG